MIPNPSSFISTTPIPQNIQAIEYLLSQFSYPDVEPHTFQQTIKLSPPKFRTILSKLPTNSLTGPKGVYLGDVQDLLNYQILDLAKSLAAPIH